MIAAGQLRATYYVAADHPDPRGVQARLDDIAVRRMPQALSSLLAPASGEQPDLWFIRRLDLDFDADLQHDDDNLAALWAARIAHALAEKVAGRDPDRGVLHFESRAEYLAAYLADRAEERGDRWCYETFAGLKLLPASAALRSAICDDPDLGWEALKKMPPPRLRAVLGAFSESDARRILDTLAAEPGAEAQAGVAQLVAAWAAVPEVKAESARALLLLLAAASPDRAARPSLHAAAAARAVARAGRLLRDLDPARAERLIAIISSGAFEGGALDAEASEALAPLAGCAPELLAPLARGRTPVQAHDDRRYTPFGGVFLLLPHIAELAPLDSCFDAPTLARMWIFAKCAGTPRAYPLFLDPLVRELAGVDPELSAQSFVRWQRRSGREQVAAFIRAMGDDRYRRGNAAVEQPGDAEFLRLPRALRASRDCDDRMSAAARLVMRNFAWRLPGFANASLHYLFDNFLDFPASVEDQPHRRVVRLGRPPLALVLNLVGISRASYACPWLGERPFELFPEH